MAQRWGYQKAGIPGDQLGVRDKAKKLEKVEHIWTNCTETLQKPTSFSFRLLGDTGSSQPCHLLIDLDPRFLGSFSPGL